MEKVAALRVLEVVREHLEQALRDAALAGTAAFGHVSAAADAIDRFKMKESEMDEKSREESLGKTVMEISSKEDTEVAAWLQSSFFQSPVVNVEKARRDMTPLQMFKSAAKKIMLSRKVIRTLSLDPDGTKDELLTRTKELQTNKVILEHINSISTFEFNVFAMNEAAGGNLMPCMAFHFFTKLKLFEAFELPPSLTLNFFQAIQDGYLDVPYHNKFHGADVMATTYALVTSPSIKSKLDDVDLFSAIVAGAIHDFKHPGTNNAFSINTEDEIALTYNDESVLENYHISQAFRLMKDPRYDLLKFLTKKQRLTARRKIIAMVLATDMSKHLNLSREAEQHIFAEPSSDPEHEQKRNMVFLGTLVHAADLGSATRPLPVAIEWADRILCEFFLQGDKERSLGLPVSSMMSRDTSIAFKGKSQKSFLEYIVLPLFHIVQKIVPEAAVAVEIAKKNHAYWEAQAASSSS